MFIFPVQLTTSRIGNLTRLIHTLLYVMTIHTYIHTYSGFGFVFTTFVMYITTTMCDGVLHCLVFTGNVFLVSLYGD